MSQNNTIRKSDKKFIRTEKARIRRQFFDIIKQEEMIKELYKRFVKEPKAAEVVKEAKSEVKKPAVKKAANTKKALAK